MIRRQNGNVLIYILIAVALMAALAYAISSDSRGNQASRMDGERVKLMSTELLSHMRDAERVVFQMQQWGAGVADIKADLPGTAAYATDTTNQLYHPSGGGLQVMGNQNDKITGAFGSGNNWRIKKTTNVEWTLSGSDDLIYTFWYLEPAICAELNKRITGSATIPVVANSFAFSYHFIEGSSSDEDFLSSECPDCVGKKSLCIRRDSDDVHIFYNILSAQ